MAVSTAENGHQGALPALNTTGVEPIGRPDNESEPLELAGDNLTYIYITVTVFYAIVFLVGILGNILVTVVVARNRDMRTSTNWYLVNLSVADLMVLVVCMPVALLEFHARDVWYLGTAMCKIVPYLENVVAHASILTIMAISFERYFATCRPLTMLYRATTQRTLKILAAVWVTTLTATLPFLLFPYVDDAIFHDGRQVKVCRTPIDSVWKQVYILTSIVVFFLIPLVVLTVIFWFISRSLSARSSSQQSQMLRQSQAAQSARTKRQVIHTLLVIIVIFFLCLLPMRVFTLWVIYSSELQKMNLGLEHYLNLISFSRIMLYANSAVNPIVYNIISTKFRKAFRRTLGCKGANYALYHSNSLTLVQSGASYYSRGSKFSRSISGKSSHNTSPL